MTRFHSRNESAADVPAPVDEIWAVLTDPHLLASLTPLVRDIRADGDLWCWQMTGISALGVEVAPAFTERMRFIDREQIDFRHQPPTGVAERAGADGTYALSDLGADGTGLHIDIAIWVDLPLPRVARGAVERVMAQSMVRTGDRFAANLYRHLGIDARRVVDRRPVG